MAGVLVYQIESLYRLVFWDTIDELALNEALEAPFDFSVCGNEPWQELLFHFADQSFMLPDEFLFVKSLELSEMSSVVSLLIRVLECHQKRCLNFEIPVFKEKVCVSGTVIRKQHPDAELGGYIVGVHTVKQAAAQWINKTDVKQKKPWPFIGALHKSFVVVCFGLTMYGLYGVSSFGYYYIVKKRPELKQKKQQLLEKEATGNEFIADTAGSYKS
ncbi:unnamed protein product [Notodromas monacha]|uniref:Uncharacterized protein n=1 Tax=Notodromas monacha TaxID=399045 RepID=A0A7R9BLF6_9CRUS|nr:unnamed protein product [Notodromas monacha]CAG0916302.1 unnamed protein product [Notodromas monacha]